MAATRLQVDELAANGEKTFFENVAAYRDVPILDSMDNEDLICKSHLSAFGGGVTEIVYKISAGSPWPAVLTNGVEFTSLKSILILGFEIAHPSIPHARTSNGASFVWDKQLNVAETLIQTITIYTNSADGTTVEQDTWVKMV